MFFNSRKTFPIKQTILKIIRLFLVLGIPCITVFAAKFLAEFSYPLDLTNLNETQTKSTTVNVDLNNQYFKNLTKIDLPFIYNVFAFNDVSVYIEASSPSSTPSKTTAVFNDTINAPYRQFTKVSTEPLQFRGEEDAQNYLLGQNIRLTFDDFHGALVKPDEYLRLKIDLSHKNIIYYFRLTLFFKIIVYIATLLALYPLFLALGGLKRFILKGEPFTNKKK